MTWWGKAVIWVGLISVILVLGHACWDRGYCWYQGWAMNRDTTYKPFVGCLIESTDGKLLPIGALREVE